MTGPGSGRLSKLTAQSVSRTSWRTYAQTSETRNEGSWSWWRGTKEGCCTAKWDRGASPVNLRVIESRLCNRGVGFFLSSFLSFPPWMASVFGTGNLCVTHERTRSSPVWYVVLARFTNIMRERANSYWYPRVDW